MIDVAQSPRLILPEQLAGLPALQFRTFGRNHIGTNVTAGFPHLYVMTRKPPAQRLGNRFDNRVCIGRRQLTRGTVQQFGNGDAQVVTGR